MYRNCPEDPRIASALRTGYYRPWQDEGDDIGEDDEHEEEEYE